MILDALIGRRKGGADSLSGVSRFSLDSIGLGRLLGGSESSAGVHVTEEKSLSLSAVWCAVNLLSNVMGSLPLNVYRRLSNGGKEVAVNHPAYRLLHSQPNPEMTAFTLRRTAEVCRLLWGNAYMEIVWDGGGNARQIWPIEPWRIAPRRDDSGQLYYHVDGRRRIEADDVIHIPLISFDGVVGRSWIDYAIDSLGLAMSSQQFAARFFGNGARPGGLLKHTGNPKKEDRQQMRESWQESHGGPDNSHKVGVIWGGWDFVRDAGSINPNDAQLLESRRFDVEETARWFGVPPHFLADLSRATFGNIEEQGINFVTYTLGPPATSYEQEYDRKLLAPPGLFSKHQFGGLLRGNMAGRAAFYKSMFEIGGFSINEILELEDRNPIGPSGDLRFVPLNMQTVDAAYQATQEPEPEPEPEPPVPPQLPPDNEIEPAVEDDPDDGQQQRAKVALLADTLGRMLRIETNAIRRAAAKQSEFAAWLNEWPAKHRQRLTDALSPVLAVLHPAGNVAEYVDAEIGASCIVLADAASKLGPDEFAIGIGEICDRWERTRPAFSAARILGVK